MELTPRLKKIAELVGDCGTLADIGTDHGYIPIYCVKNGICQRALAMDINEGPICAAHRNITLHNLQDKIETRLSDGMMNLKKGEADCVVIAGMGGLLINKILQNSLNDLTKGQIFVVQPMIAPEEVRRFLNENNFEIMTENLECEGEKLYNIIKARFGYEQSLSQTQIAVGMDIGKTSPQLYPKYLAWKIGILNKKINGLNHANNKDFAQIEKANQELKLYTEEAKRYDG